MTLKYHPLVSPLFNDVVQCLGTPLLEIKKSELLHHSGIRLGILRGKYQWCISTSLAMAAQNQIRSTLSFRISFR